MAMRAHFDGKGGTTMVTLNAISGWLGNGVGVAPACPREESARRW